VHAPDIINVCVAEPEPALGSPAPAPEEPTPAQPRGTEETGINPHDAGLVAADVDVGMEMEVEVEVDIEMDVDVDEEQKKVDADVDADVQTQMNEEVEGVSVLMPSSAPATSAPESATVQRVPTPPQSPTLAPIPPSNSDTNSGVRASLSTSTPPPPNSTSSAAPAENLKLVPEA
jgi:hypothetical protein